MTIAELQLARMRPIVLSENSLAELDRARRARRYNIFAMIAVWAGLWFYGLDRLATASDLAAGLDRFLPLQLVAAVAALAVLLSRRSLRHGLWTRRLALVPTAVTLAGAAALVWSLFTQFPGQQAPALAGADTPAPFRVELVSL